MKTESSSTPAALSLQGQTVSPGVAYGRVFVRDEGFGPITKRVLKASEIELEMARVDSAARSARVSLVHQRDELASRFTAEQRRIFDAHLKILEDPSVEADIRNRIREGMNLEAAVRDVLEVYERLCQVVETEAMRNKLADLRDVAWRLLQHCDRGRAEDESETEPVPMSGGILVVRELSVSDLTEALEKGVTAIVAEAGTEGSHGTILTRAAGLPALINVKGIHEAAASAQHLLLDGETGQAILDPAPELVSGTLGKLGETLAAEELGPAVLADGTRIYLEAAIASPAEARRSASSGIREVGLLRTELPFIQRHGNPREDSLSKFHSKVLRAVDSAIFRLPDVDSSTGLERLYGTTASDPKLGLRGVRLFLEYPDLLGVQLRAIIRASVGQPVRISIPFVTDLADLRRVREAVDNAREELRLEGLDVSHPIQIGAIFETPSSALLAREIMGASDFALIGLDVLCELLVAADASSSEESVRKLTETPHPTVLRAVRKLVQLAEGLDKEIRIYGERIATGCYLPLLVGLGLRRFVLRPGLLHEAQAALQQLDLEQCERIAEAACRCTSSQEIADLLPGTWC
jgi:phosphoenolpyruvate-protein phosphotransferase (PTS system enzyme I)